MAQTREEVFKDLVDIFYDQLGVEKDKIKESSDAVEDLGADDLDCVELVMSIEEQYGFGIPEEDFEKFGADMQQHFYVGKCVDYICSRLGISSK